MNDMFKKLAIPDVFVFVPKRFADDRGFFVQTYNRQLLDTITGPLDWVQENQSRSNLKGTVRGLHFQIAPFAQDKLVRCLRGAILDVAVDIRRGSPTFGRHVTTTLTAEIGEQIFVPKGFAHGFVTLEDACEIAYKVTNHYSADHDKGIQWSDPALGIQWNLDEKNAIVSAKDKAAPLLADTPEYFRYDA